MGTELHSLLTQQLPISCEEAAGGQAPAWVLSAQQAPSWVGAQATQSVQSCWVALSPEGLCGGPSPDECGSSVLITGAAEGTCGQRQLALHTSTYSLLTQPLLQHCSVTQACPSPWVGLQSP